jgi:biopolymer transport protein ExbD
MTVKIRKRRGAVMSEINITPFTDVTLVLLIIFMITTPVIMNPAIKVNLPRSQVFTSEDTSNIEVLISKEGYVYIEGKQINNSNIEDVIGDIISSRRDKAIVIKGDRKVQYDHIINFIDKAKKVGATRFALAVDNNNISEK